MTRGESGAQQQTDLPVGQNQFDVAHVALPEASKQARKRLREKTNFSCRFNAILPVQIFRKKYSALCFLLTVSSLESSRLMQRGVRVVTIRGVRVAVDARRPRARGIAGRPQAWSWGCERSIRAQDERRYCVRQKRVVLAPVAGVKLAEAVRIQPGSISRQSGSDGGKRNSSPGRARHKPSNHCAGKAGCSPLDLYARVRTSLCTLHTRPRVQRAPGLPCALDVSEGETICKTSGETCRENANSCPAVIASEAKQSRVPCATLDCFVADAPRNDGSSRYI